MRGKSQTCRRDLHSSLGLGPKLRSQTAGFLPDRQVEDLPRIGVAKPLQKSQSAVVRYLIKPFSLAQAFTPGDEDYGI